MNLKELYGVEDKPQAFDQVGIILASPEVIRNWSRGEVQNPETINYRTFKPEKGGLFCERIFGPTRDWECTCGKYKRIKHKGVTCDRCGVEVTLSRVRRERMGHIELAVPVTHIWFYKCMPSRLGLMLDMSARHLERVIYYEDYIVIEPGQTPLEKGQLLTEIELRDAEDEYGEESFRAGMGADAIRALLANIKLDPLIVELQDQVEQTRSKQTKKKLAKRLKLSQGFANSKTRPEWMVMTTLPVIPPDLRPLVPLEGGRFATSDLNDLYRRVINRNNRLKNLLMLKTPEVIIRNEKRMLQEAVDALFDNGRHGRAVTGAGNRPLKSLSDMLKGKGGRFRQNLLGKRVDYSGRSVIVIGPDLKLSQCGLPKTMALTLFEPFIIRRLKELGYCHTVRSAKKMIDRKTTEVWDILEEVTKGHPVMLNRAPTLHRLSIQAFEPVLIEGSAIRLHPLTCSAYNADFDGDQMAVHVPLSIEAQMEARQLMLAPNNIFSPASGKPITTPSQDIILGAYYLTYIRETTKPESLQGLPLFENAIDMDFALSSGKIVYQDWVLLRNPDFGKKTIFGNADDSVILTSAGRVMFNEIWPDEIGFINKTISKKQMGNLIWRTYQTVGKKRTVESLDKLKALGFKEAMYSGASIGMVDMVIPEDKPEILKKSYDEVATVEKQFKNGIITNGERYQRVIDIWTRATDSLSSKVFDTLVHNFGKREANPLFMMVDSGARGNKNQIKQLSGMRGLMAKPSGEIIERPITSNFREGLSVLEYFISTHGARKGLADTALKTADSGYMTRKLVDVSQDVIVTQEDCKTSNGLTVFSLGDEEGSISNRIYGRVAAEKITRPDGEVICEIDDLLDEEKSKAIEDLGVDKMIIRSALTCESDHGICGRCYGQNLATGVMAKPGEAVGIIAAQSIGEPGTQLTMRTFHSGGVAFGGGSKPLIQVKNSGKLIYNDIRCVEDPDGNFVVLNKNGSLSVRDLGGMELENHKLVIGTLISVADGEMLTKGDEIATWDAHAAPVISEKPGIIEFNDMINGITYTQDAEGSDEGQGGLTVIEHKEDLHPQVKILDSKTKAVLATYAIPVGARLSVKQKEKISAGQQIARTPRKAERTKDITGGLPKIAELFEARRPKDACVISKIDGIVSFGGTVRGKKKVIVTNQDSGDSEDHLVPMGKHIIVAEDEFMKRGEKITDGAIAPEDLLEACGVHELQEHLVNEVQSVYRAQGVEINDKHIEIIIRQMLRKVKITDPGDSEFLWGDQIERATFRKTNRELAQQGGKAAEGESILLGITKASLETESFISAASFQDTTRVLTEAATLGKVDNLMGFKENVIMGHLIPGGSGFSNMKNVEIEFTEEEPEPTRRASHSEEELNANITSIGESAPAPSSLKSEEDDDLEIDGLNSLLSGSLGDFDDDDSIEEDEEASDKKDDTDVA